MFDAQELCLFTKYCSVALARVMGRACLCPFWRLPLQLFGRASNPRRQHHAYQRSRTRRSVNRPSHPIFITPNPPHSRRDGAKATGPGRAVGHASTSAPAPQAPRPPSEQARDEPMPGRNVISVGYVEPYNQGGPMGGCIRARGRIGRGEVEKKLVLTCQPQVAGHRQDTACRAAQHWSKSCGSAWISRYVLAGDST